MKEEVRPTDYYYYYYLSIARERIHFSSLYNPEEEASIPGGNRRNKY
jgi:hypothetical protein